MKPPDLVSTTCTSVALKSGKNAMLRPAVAEHAEGLVEIQRQVVAENVANVDDHVDTPDECRQRMHALSPLDLWLVAECNGQVLGSIRLLAPAASFLKHVRNLFIDVHRDWRSEGVGAALIAAGTEWAKDHGVTMIALSVLDSNPRARALYERLGFRVTGHTPNLVMRPDGSRSDDTQMLLVL